MNTKWLFCLLLILSLFSSVALHAYGTPFISFEVGYGGITSGTYAPFINDDPHLQSYRKKANGVTYRLSGGYSFVLNQHFTIGPEVGLFMYPITHYTYSLPSREINDFVLYEYKGNSIDLLANANFYINANFYLLRKLRVANIKSNRVFENKNVISAVNNANKNPLTTFAELQKIHPYMLI